MLNNKHIGLIGALTLMAGASLYPLTASQAHDGHHKIDKEWGENLGKEIAAKVHAGMAKGANGMEKGAEKMLRGADKMDAYADRLERDPEFRQSEAAKQSKWRDGAMTAQELQKKIPELRRGAKEMREGAEDMREAAQEMRSGGDS